VGCVVERVHLQHSNIAGLLVVGSNHTLRELLIENVDWMGSLDFPAIQIGFFSMHCNFPNASKFDPNRCGHMGADKGFGVGGGPMGEDNLISRVTVRRFGGGGIVTSQLSNVVEYAHLYGGSTVGLDQAGIHADNLAAHTDTLCATHNCAKEWRYNWVHHIRDKCVRGDDGSLNMSVHHNIIFHCGARVVLGPLTSNAQGNSAHELLQPVARVSGCGVMLKGDNHLLYANTVWGTIGQGDIVLDTRKGPPCSATGGGCVRGNNHTLFFNTGTQRVAGKPHGTPINSTLALIAGIVEVHPNRSTPLKNITQVTAALGLHDAAHFDFRPRSDGVGSPLVGAGASVPPFTDGSELPPGSNVIDCGAYQAHEQARSWVPGCTFKPECGP
jgi:hypothetical protein